MIIEDNRMVKVADVACLKAHWRKQRQDVGSLPRFSDEGGSLFPQRHDRFFSFRGFCFHINGNKEPVIFYLFENLF